MYRALLLALALGLAACEGAIRDPVGLGNGGNGGTIGGGGGGNGGSVLQGSWQTVFLFRLSDDVQTHTVTWNFGNDGSCRRVVEIYSVLEDRTLTTTSTCTFRSGGGDVAITFEGSASPVSFRWSLEHFSRDRLILDGVTYDRVG